MWMEDNLQLCYLRGRTAHSQRAVRQASSCHFIDVTMARNSTDSQAAQDLLQAQHGLVSTLGLTKRGRLFNSGITSFPEQQRSSRRRSEELEKEGGTFQSSPSGRQTSAFFMFFRRLLMTSLKEPTRNRPSCSNREPRHATAALKYTHTQSSSVHLNMSKYKKKKIVFAFPPLCSDPEGNATYSRVGRLDGESSLLRMMSLHLSTNRVEGTGSPR